MRSGEEEEEEEGANNNGGHFEVMRDESEGNGPSDLLAVVGALLDTLEDKNDEVREAVVQSVRKISRHSPETVIRAAVYYREMHRKMPESHVSAVLRVMMETCRDGPVNLEGALATSVAELAVEELTNSDTDRDASELLVSLSRWHCTEAMGGILYRFGPGVVPNNATITAMGMVASCNPFNMVPFIKLILNVMLPMLAEVRGNVQKQAFCFTLGKFAEAINDYVMNLEEAPDPDITKDAFAEEMSTVFDVLAYDWLKTGRHDAILAESILTALSPILPLLPPNKTIGERSVDRVSRLVSVVLNLIKWPNARLASTRVLATLLNCIYDHDRVHLVPYFEQLHQTLFDLVSVTPFEAYRDALLTHYEVLQCFRSIVVLNPEALDRILQQLKSPTGNHRARALVILKYLINTLPNEDDVTLGKIALCLQNALTDGSAKQMVGVIVALAAHPTFPLLPSQRATFIRFMVLRCGFEHDEPQAYEEALYLLATTVEGAESWLWPLLVRTLLDPIYVASAIPVLRALSALAVKIIRGDGSSANLRNEFAGTKVLARCIELMGEEKNRHGIVAFLRSSAPLMGHSLKPKWEARLLEITKTLEAEDATVTSNEKIIAWEESMVDFLEESVELEGETWASKLADELATRSSSPGVPPYLAAITNDPWHLSLLVESTKTQTSLEDSSRSLGFASKRHLNKILELMEEACTIENTRRNPMKLLGLVRDSKAAASTEAIKANLLRGYTEIAKRADAAELFSAIERHILPWILRQFADSKDVNSKAAALVALEQVVGAVHPNRLGASTGLNAKGTSLAVLLALLQSNSGHRKLQIYPAILRAIIALLRVPPSLSEEERTILLSQLLDKVIAASSVIDTLLPLESANEIVASLSIACSEVVQDSADGLAELVDVLLPWMQSKSSSERLTTLTVLRSTLKSYHDSLKYTYPSGRLEPGKLLGRILSLCADPEIELRSLVVDCVALSLGIGARHRSTLTDNNLTRDLSESKKILNTKDSSVLYEGVKALAIAGCERIASGEVTSLAEGLVEGLLFRAEGGLAAGIGLTQLFRIRGGDIPRADLYLIDSVIAQMRQMENTSCRRGAAGALKALSTHHPQVIEHLLHQPLPPDRGTEECWNELGADEEIGLETLDYLLKRLEMQNPLAESQTSQGNSGKYNTAAFPSLAAIVSLRHLLQSTNSERLIEKRLPELVSTLLKHLAGWLHVDAPVSVLSTKFGFVPNREASKLNPHREVYSVLANIMTVVNSSVASSLLNESVFDSESQAEENLVSTVRSVVRCMSTMSDVLSNLAQSLGKLVMSPLPAQRAVAIAFFGELIGRVDCGSVWLDAMMNTLHEAKSDSSPLVRKLATIGLTRIAYLDPKEIDEYFESCTEALLEGLEEPANSEGGADVVLESLRGLSILLSKKTDKPTSPRVVLALKPFVEKENWEMRLSAINALGALSTGWTKSIVEPDDDVTDHLLGCLPCLTMKIEDPNDLVSKAARKTLCEASNLFQSDQLADIVKTHLAQGNETNVEAFLRELIECLKNLLPRRAEELRNAVVRGYSRSENSSTRATSVLILGLFGHPRPEDVQRILQLLRDKESIVKARAAKALALSFTQND